MDINPRYPYPSAATKTVTTEEMKKSSSESSPPPQTSFSSIPYDVALNILARISRMHHPKLSLVSKSFQSLLASRELQVTRTLIEKTENYIYLCLNYQKNSNACWYILPPTPTQQKLIPIPSFPYEYPESPSVVSIGSEIYIIGGLVKKKRSKKVFLRDCGSHQWRILPEMRIPRTRSVAGLIDGKIYVLGGCRHEEKWGEIYDPKTQNWELLSPTILTPVVSCMQKSTQEWMAFVKWLNFYGCTNLCFVAEEKILCTCTSFCFKGLGLYWCDAEENTDVREVKGLEGLSHSIHFISSGGRRLTVWSTECNKFSKMEIRCSEISFERRSREELYGILEWSKIVYTLDFSYYVSLLCSVTH